MNWLNRTSWVVLVGFSAGMFGSGAVLADGWDDPGWLNPGVDLGPAAKGVWHDVMDWPVEAIHAIHLPPKDPGPWISLQPPMGKILVFASGDGPPPHLWNPATNTIVATDPLGSNVFCSGHAHLADGTPLVAGGNYIADTNLFDYDNELWISAAGMAYERFYPTCTTLPKGNILVTSGKESGGQFAGIPEIYDDVADQWYPLPNSAYMPFDSLYPLQFLLPDGRLATVGATDGPETKTYWLDFGTNVWTEVTENSFAAGSAAMYLPGHVLVSGSSGTATDEAAVIDFNPGVLPVLPTWDAVDPMYNARTDHDLTILADGTVLAVGGRGPGGSVFEAELYVPSQQSWKRLASTSEPREYHSTTILLSDGRVLAAGGREDHTAEVFSPPYLYWGQRPYLASAPGVVGYDQSFEVKTAQAADIKRVALVGLGAVTHSNDMNQRYIPLNFSAGVNSLKVRSPKHEAIAPRGVYMLFILSSNGVPSYARYVRLD